MLSPSPQNASSRSGSSGCCRDRLAGAMRAGRGCAPALPRPSGRVSAESPEYAACGSSTFSVRRRPTIRQTPLTKRTCALSASCLWSARFVVVRKRHVLPIPSHRVGKVERHPPATHQHVRRSGLQKRLCKQQGNLLPLRVHPCQQACNICGRRSWRWRFGWWRRFSRSSTGLGKTAHCKCIIACGHLDLDPDHAGLSAVLPDAMRRRIVARRDVRHPGSISGNDGYRQSFRKRPAPGMLYAEHSAATCSQTLTARCWLASFALLGRRQLAVPFSSVAGPGCSTRRSELIENFLHRGNKCRTIMLGE